MRTLLVATALFLAAALLAQTRNPPRQGTYTWPEREGWKIVLTPSKDGNFAMSGGAGSATFKGTLFIKTGRLRGTVRYKVQHGPKKGQMREGPIDGSWDYFQGALMLDKFDGIPVDWEAMTPGGRERWEKYQQKAGARVDGFTGTWDTSFGKMTMTQSGKSVSGTYDYYSGKIEGNIKDDGQLYFTWTQKNPDKNGTGFFKLASDGMSFSGSWDYTLSTGKPANNGGGWSGKRMK